MRQICQIFWKRIDLLYRIDKRNQLKNIIKNKDRVLDFLFEIDDPYFESYESWIL